MWIEIEMAAAILPTWVWYVTGVSHGLLTAFYLPAFVTRAVHYTATLKA